MWCVCVCDGYGICCWHRRHGLLPLGHAPCCLMFALEPNVRPHGPLTPIAWWKPWKRIWIQMRVNSKRWTDSLGGRVVVVVVVMASIAQQKSDECDVVETCRFATERGNKHFPFLIKSAAHSWFLSRHSLGMWLVARLESGFTPFGVFYSASSGKWWCGISLIHALISQGCPPQDPIHHFQLGVYFPGFDERQHNTFQQSPPQNNWHAKWLIIHPD